MMETDYLLQRIEGYTGAVILATNLRQHIDEAFLRRIQVVIEFPFPDKDQRAELWIRALHRRLPDQAREQLADEFSVQLLAERYSLSGAAIEEVAEDAELITLRATHKKQFNQADILAALSREMRKTGKPQLS
jgi:SpoVK/Ycf46/Vps4 family AAA+-type ATPase